MAKVVVPRNQQLAMAALHPKPYYSRVVSVHLYLDPPGTDVFVVTPTLGNRIWLLGVRVFADKKPLDSSQLVSFDIVTGMAEPAGVGDVKKWDRVLPIQNYHYGWEPWRIFDGSHGRVWSMMKFYEGTERRFGVWGWRDGEDNMRMQVSFEISEG